MEEREQYSYGIKGASKQRVIAQQVTPAQPHYTHGMGEGLQDLAMPQPKPLVGE